MGAIARWIIGPIAGPVFGVAVILLSIGWATTTLVSRHELATVTADRDRLQDAIYNPSTGYLARNTQCETNVAQLQAAIVRTAADIKKLGDDTIANGKRIGDLMAQQRAGAAAAKATADKLLALPSTAPRGTIEACSSAARILKTGAP
jgi:hypothetical protein